MDKADMILSNGKILSVSIDNKIIKGEAIAVKNGKILKIGSDEEILLYKCKQTKMIDCEGKTVLPGLCDAHCHISSAASISDACDLFGVYIQENQTPDEVIDEYMRRLKVYIDENPEKELIIGSGWVISNFSGERMPTRHDIDKICSDKPVILKSFCFHNLWANTKAIELAGVNANTPDVEAGEICRETGGYPTGLFKDPEAMHYIEVGVPGYIPSVGTCKNQILFGQKAFANKYGVTMFQDCMHTDEARDAYRELAAENKLTVRVKGVYMVEPVDRYAQLSAFAERKGKDNVSDLFGIDSVKIFVEGGFVFIDGYLKKYLDENDLPDGYNGESYFTEEELTEIVSKSLEADFDVHIHAMGDESIRKSIAAISQAQELTGVHKRNVIAHMMLLSDEEARKMGDANIMANCQPRWMVHDSDVEVYIEMIGKEKAENVYPLRKLLDNNVRVCFGTDYPVTPPPSTMHEIQCAMTRSVFPDAPDYNKFKGIVLGGEMPATLYEAIRALTIEGAYQMRLEKITGSIEEGKSADFVILNRDLENTPVGEIYATEVEKTIFKGNIVYERGE